MRYNLFLTEKLFERHANVLVSSAIIYIGRKQVALERHVYRYLDQHVLSKAVCEVSS
jgi:hypothetical protein